MKRKRDTDHVNPAIADLLVNIDDLREDGANARLHSERNTQAIADSLRRFGQQKAIVVRQDGTVIAGNGTLRAAQLLGWKKIAAIRWDGDDLNAVAYAIADNRTAELAVWDPVALQATLRTLEDYDPDLRGLLAFNDSELDAITEGFVPSGDGEGEPEGNEKWGAGVFSREQIVESALGFYRANGFPYRKVALHTAMQEINALSNLSADKLLGTPLGHAIADTYHPHRFHVKVEGKHSPVDGFADDKVLRRTFEFMLDNGTKIGEGYNPLFGLVLGGQAANNFRPGLALSLYRRFCDRGSVVLDTSTGFGGRLVAFMASKAARYVGIDPNSQTHAGNTRMASDLGFSDRVKLIAKPAEDVSASEIGARCDFAFTSPPYFRKEHYSDEATQSWVRYEKGEAWREGFLVPMLALQFAALKPGAASAININDIRLGSRSFPLVEWTIDAATRAGFALEERAPMPFAHLSSGETEDDEPLLIFRKP